LIDGFTPQERFFLAFACAFRTKLTEAKLLFMMKIDPHAPVELRVNGVLSNMIGFYQIYNVTEHDQMFREPSKRVLIW
jgi:putative endopeptidase